MIMNTRLRNVKSKKLENILIFLNQLPFKVELKTLVFDGKFFNQTFVIPDSVKNMQLETLL